MYAPSAMHRKSVRAKGTVHEASIAAWEVRVRRLADRDPPETQFLASQIEEHWLKGLVALTGDVAGPAKAIDYLRSAGVALVIERHLPGTLLDGAALASTAPYAIVALTLRHDRLDNFWFTLLHELGHLKLHISEPAIAAIFDDTESPADSDLEDEADFFAQEALLSEEKWKAAVSRYTRSERAVLTDARRFGVGPAIIAGRIRREANDYTLLTNLVGAGAVRQQFGL